ELRALRQRLVFRYTLTPLGPEDSQRYIAARLETAGVKRLPFTLSACEAVHNYSRGVPRLINVICDNTLLAGYASDRTLINHDLIDEVAIDLRLEAVSPKPKHIEMKGYRADYVEELNSSSHRGLVYALIIALAVVAISIFTISTMAVQAND